MIRPSDGCVSVTSLAWYYGDSGSSSSSIEAVVLFIPAISMCKFTVCVVAQGKESEGLLPH